MNQTYNGDSSVIYKSGTQKTFYQKSSSRDQMMNSFDNIWAPFESKTFYRQNSPFSSTHTLNNTSKIMKNSFTSNWIKEPLVNNQLLKHNSESQKVIKESSWEGRETEFYIPERNIIESKKILR